MHARPAPAAGARTVEPVRQPVVALFRLLLSFVYAAPLLVPLVAEFAHAAGHMAEAHAEFVSSTYAGPVRGAVHPHSHPHAGDHRHDGESGHGVAIMGLLAAADAMGQDGDTLDAATPPVIPVHLPGTSLASLPSAAGAVMTQPASDTRPARMQPRPPTPPPRSAATIGQPRSA